jgi:dihydrofolate reductase
MGIYNPRTLPGGSFMTAATATRRKKEKPEATAGPSTRNVVLSVAVSLDGYIARRDGSVDWLIMDPEMDFKKMVSAFDVIVAGRKTLDPALDKGGGGGMGKMACFVFSRTLPPGKRNGVEYVGRPPKELVRELKAQPGKDIWLMGGGELAREFLRDDLIDRIELAVIPVLLGSGIPLFPSGFPQRNYALAEQRSYSSGILSVSYVRSLAAVSKSR